jgi:hypothetical protein
VQSSKNFRQHKINVRNPDNNGLYADKSLARPGKKQVTATATEDSDFHISYL